MIPTLFNEETEFLSDSNTNSLKRHYMTFYSRQFAIFKDGCQEDWIKRLMAFREIENLMPMMDPADLQTCAQDQDVSDFFEGSSLILL
jgi:hypothetical protein